MNKTVLTGALVSLGFSTGGAPALAQDAGGECALFCPAYPDEPRVSRGEGKDPFWPRERALFAPHDWARRSRVLRLPLRDKRAHVFERVRAGSEAPEERKAALRELSALGGPLLKDLSRDMRRVDERREMFREPAIRAACAKHFGLETTRGLAIGDTEVLPRYAGEVLKGAYGCLGVERGSALPDERSAQVRFDYLREVLALASAYRAAVRTKTPAAPPAGGSEGGTGEGGTAAAPDEEPVSQTAWGRVLIDGGDLGEPSEDKPVESSVETSTPAAVPSGSGPAGRVPEEAKPEPAEASVPDEGPAPTHEEALRARERISSQILGVEPPAWRGATREHTRRYVTEEQRSQAGWIAVQKWEVILSRALRAVREAAGGALKILEKPDASPEDIESASAGLSRARTGVIEVFGHIDARPVPAGVPETALPGDRLPIPAAAFDTVAEAGSHADKREWDSALASLDRARGLAPGWREPEWLSATVLGLMASENPDAGSAAAAREAYADFSAKASGHRFASEAAKAAEALSRLEAALRLPDVPVYERRRREKTVRRWAGFYFGAPNVYLDLGGASFGGDVLEWHAARVMVFSPRWRVGLGTAIFSRHDTPWKIAVSGRGQEGTAITTLFPIEVAVAPINLKTRKNYVLSPQLYFSYAGWGKASSTSLKENGTGFSTKVREIGLRVPLGPLFGFRVVNLKVRVPDGDLDVIGRTYTGYDESKTYFAFDLFFGGMFGVPSGKPR